MLVALLFVPVVTPIGLIVALWGFRWPPPRWRPYAPILGALGAPLACLLLLQVFMGLPAGACAERPLNGLPVAIAVFAVALAPAVVFFARGRRRFATGAALAITPLTLFSAPMTMMSLAGCWM